jgi:hypothetical protein
MRSIAASVHKVPDEIRLDFSVIYPPTGSSDTKEWKLTTQVNSTDSTPALYLEFLKVNGFPDAALEETFTANKQKFARFVLRKASTAEVLDRV